MKEDVLNLINELLELMEDLEGNQQSLDNAYDHIVEAQALITKYAAE